MRGWRQGTRAIPGFLRKISLHGEEDIRENIRWVIRLIGIVDYDDLAPAEVLTLFLRYHRGLVPPRIELGEEEEVEREMAGIEERLGIHHLVTEVVVSLDIARIEDGIDVAGGDLRLATITLQPVQVLVIAAGESEMTGDGERDEEERSHEQM